MRRLAVVLALAACGGSDDAPGPDPDVAACTPAMLPAGDIAAQLAAIPCLTATELPAPGLDMRRFQLRITQPVDHDDPDGATFTQDVTLLHRDVAAPMVMVESGYTNDYGDWELEPTSILEGNQIVVEHRFFDDSRPEPADWSKLTIAQQAADDHRTIVALSQIYTGPWITTGISKGGMTTTYHRRFYPDDVDGTLPYVAPISFAIRDPRYLPHLETLGTTQCREAIRAVQRELLANRRAMLVTRAQAAAAELGYQFTRISLEAAVEATVAGVDWSFWQYAGIDYCPGVPTTTASDDVMWQFLQQHYSVGAYADSELGKYEAYYYQAEAELGYPVEGNPNLEDLLQFEPSAYDGLLPPGVPRPTLRSDAMRDVADWVAASGEHFAFIYGEWDPWTGGMYDLGGATDSLRVIAPMATHSAAIYQLTTDDQIDVLSKLGSWTGTQPRTRPWTPRDVRRPVPPSLFMRR